MKTDWFAWVKPTAQFFTGGLPGLLFPEQLVDVYKPVSLYNPGTVLGDVDSIDDLPQGGEQGGGGFQLPVVNEVVYEWAEDKFEDLVPDWLVPVAIGAGLLALG